MLVYEIVSESLLKLGLGNNEVVNSLIFRELCLCEGELGVIKLDELASSHTV